MCVFVQLQLIFFVSCNIMKKQLLDPIGTLCKLVGLNFSKNKTKIKIHNHVLTLDQPTDTQGVARWWNGDGKDNVSELYNVIVCVIRWYLVKNKGSGLRSSRSNTMASSTSSIKLSHTPKSNFELLADCPEFIKMINYLCDSLAKLQETYMENFGNVVLSIQFYINILQDAIYGRFNESLLPACVLAAEEEHDNLLDYDKIKNIWDTGKIKRICDLYDSCFTVSNDTKIKDESYRDALINGYLQSIDAILTLTDKEFQKLIKNSNKG